MESRRQRAKLIRENAADLADRRNHPRHLSNGEEAEYRRGDGSPSHIANFTKGLPHNDLGLLEEPIDYVNFVMASDSGDPQEFHAIRLGPGPFTPSGENRSYEIDSSGRYQPVHNWKTSSHRDNRVSARAWESQGAGQTFDLEGPDAQAVTMPPAPRLNSQEFLAEMAEVYWMSILRDTPFQNFANDEHVNMARCSLPHFAWFNSEFDNRLTEADRQEEAQSRRRIHVNSSSEKVPLSVLFRGQTAGDSLGPYISQFLLIGNEGINSRAKDRHFADGLISFGSIRIEQKVLQAKAGVDYMMDWDSFLDVQNGADLRGGEEYESEYRFITTPRDLATYVHYDALYEAYFNACLILLGMGAPFDSGIPFQEPDFRDKQHGFSHFGAPHILSLVTEVATRALKAARFQKFNVHRRLRPEAAGGLLHQWADSKRVEFSVMQPMLEAFSGASALASVIQEKTEGTLLLPMAFAEGSPMHPSYAAGHATVAGACTTILKAFFDTGWELPLVNCDGKPVAYVADASTNGTSLSVITLEKRLTVGGELNKLASNISIGRNWAGVHYYSDYIESLRMGEKVALGILEEQKLTYGENFSMTIPLFDGGSIRI